MATAYILLHIFLTVLKRSLSKLGSHLRGRIIHELAITAKDVAAAAGAALLLVRVPGGTAITLLLRLRGARGRRRRSQLGNGRDVLRHRVVQWRRLPVRRPLHGEGSGVGGCDPWEGEWMAMGGEGSPGAEAAVAADRQDVRSGSWVCVVVEVAGAARGILDICSVLEVWWVCCYSLARRHPADLACAGPHQSLSATTVPNRHVSNHVSSR